MDKPRTFCRADIASAFRQDELERRAQRRLQLLKLWENEAALLKEELSPEDWHANRTAIANIEAQNTLYRLQTEASLGYWKRLWYAVCGKVVL